MSDQVQSAASGQLFAIVVTIRGRKTAYVRERTCSCCGKVESVRKDNTAEVCGRCSRISRLTNANAVRSSKCNARHELRACSRCGCMFRVQSGRSKFCSVSCWRASQAESRIERVCKRCGSKFSVAPGVLSGKTAASANFCCRACYHRWLADEERTKHYGSRWKAIRSDAVDRAGFCALCGKLSVIDVHHIVPYRISKNNGQENLIGLCKKHHKLVELLTQEAISAGSDAETVWLVFNSLLAQWQAATYQALKQLGYSKRYDPRTCVPD